MFIYLTLQPAVEAFFLVHSSSSTSSRDRILHTNSENREVVPELAPVSPIYSDNEGTSQTEAANNTSWDITPAPQRILPPDQLKFLKFAGMYLNCNDEQKLYMCAVIYIHKLTCILLLQRRTGLY